MINPLKCVFIVGTRPEVIKIAPVYLLMKYDPIYFEPILWVTGQHKELLKQALDIFNITPDLDLDLMESNQSQIKLIGKILIGLDNLICHHQPDWIVVQGDTTTAFAGALAGFYSQTPVAHIEAGLRTFDITSPFPEEGNRQLISKLATLHFTPTENAKNQLLAEGIISSKICTSGNTVIDSVLWTLKHKPNTFIHSTKKKLNQKIILVTLHRRESFGSVMEGMLEAIKSLADDSNLNLFFYFPIHPNPNINEKVKLILDNHPSIQLLEPLRYDQMIYLMSDCWLIMTDSGGIQEEAPSMKIPVFVLRDTTERSEGVKAGIAKLIGTQPTEICQHVQKLIADKLTYNNMKNSKNPYGSGNSSNLIISKLKSTVFN